jgi:hypothetical protein
MASRAPSDANLRAIVKPIPPAPAVMAILLSGEGATFGFQYDRPFWLRATSATSATSATRNALPDRCLTAGIYYYNPLSNNILPIHCFMQAECSGCSAETSEGSSMASERTRQEIEGD